MSFVNLIEDTDWEFEQGLPPSMLPPKKPGETLGMSDEFPGELPGLLSTREVFGDVLNNDESGVMQEPPSHPQ